MHISKGCQLDITQRDHYGPPDSLAEPPQMPPQDTQHHEKQECMCTYMIEISHGYGARVKKRAFTLPFSLQQRE